MTSAEAKEVARLQAVVGAWYQAGVSDRTQKDRAAEFRDYFPTIGNGDPSRDIKTWLRHHDKRDWYPIAGYFSAMPVTAPGRDDVGEQTLWPLVNFHLRALAGRVQAMIRIVLCAENDEGLVDGWGWRFDSADADRGVNSHPYAHVQHITTWKPGSQGFRWPEFGGFQENEVGEPVEHRKTIPESKPAVPLACSDAGGLALAAMMSLYGANRTAEILRGVSQVDDAFRALSGFDKTDVLDPD